MQVDAWTHSFNDRRLVDKRPIISTILSSCWWAGIGAYGCIVIPVVEENHLCPMSTCFRTRSFAFASEKTHLLIVKICPSHERIVHRMDNQRLNENIRTNVCNLSHMGENRGTLTPKRPSVY